MVWVEPTTHVSPPLGAVRARAPRILKFAGDVEVTAVSLLRVILTLTVVEIASGTVQAKLPPAAGVEPVIKIGVTKLSVEYSRLTVGIAPAPVEVQEMVLTAPTFQTSVPTGLVTVRPPLIVKAALESSETVVSAVLVTRTFTLVEARSGIVHA